jgi:hypothetical protein
MVRNTDGLMRSARLRSEDATQRATSAFLLMQAEEVEINFRSVAARAKVSTAWLDGTKSVRDSVHNNTERGFLKGQSRQIVRS